MLTNNQQKPDFLLIEGQPWVFSPNGFAEARNLMTSGEIDEDEEFICAWPLTADMTAAACLMGFMPLSYQDDSEKYVIFTPKLHKHRMLLNPEKIKINKTNRRRSRNYCITVNAAFEQVVMGCQKQYGTDWLTPPLAEVYTEMHRHRHQMRVQFVSVELWRDGYLTAGELGYRIGDVYASLTGFYNESGAGSVQIAALAGLLQEQGIKIWDLGMPISYKYDLGGKNLRREHFLQILDYHYKQPAGETLAETSPMRMAATFVKT